MFSILDWIMYNVSGVYLVLFYNCSYVLFVRRQKRRWHHQILATVMCGLSAAHLGLNINSLFQRGPYLSLARFLLYITSKWVNTIIENALVNECLKRHFIFIPCSAFSERAGVWHSRKTQTFRCSFLWNNTWRIIFAPCVCLSCSSGF